MKHEIILNVVFFCSERGNEPVRQWLKSLHRDDCSIIGHDIQAVQFRWPIGMPLVRNLSHTSAAGLWSRRLEFK